MRLLSRSNLDDLCLFPACNNPSTALVIVPSAPSVRFSHVRLTSKPEDSLFERVSFERIAVGPSRLEEGTAASSSETDMIRLSGGRARKLWLGAIDLEKLD